MKKNTVVCSLDASKAFDKVNRTILWRQLIERNIRPYLVVGLINYYNNSYMIINNKNLFSVSFKSIVGVKQGGKCSPKLFSIYLQTLLEIISNNDTGIKINSTKIDIIAYADDVPIISSSKYSLQKALDLVNKLGEDFEILFNPLKTFYIIFNPSCSNSQPEDIQLELSGLNIQRADSLKYLGVELNEKNDDRKHIEHRIKSSRVALAKLKNLEILTNKTAAYLKGHLYKVYIMPVLTYGLETCNINKSRINELERVENKLLRNMYNLPRNCRISSLRLINNIDKFNNRLKILQIEFFVRLVKNKFTLEIIKELLTYESCGEYISKIFETLGQIEYPDEKDIISKCSYYTLFMTREHLASKKNNLELNKLQKIFTERNGDSSLIYELLKFDK